ncbi:hypothetical protein SFRURICE_005925 [Spodoptera frugiperda]|nr:hypothetical protein SFRURICE_005925 [Spodoptera frugiperda]
MRTDDVIRNACNAYDAGLWTRDFRSLGNRRRPHYISLSHRKALLVSSHRGTLHYEQRARDAALHTLGYFSIHESINMHVYLDLFNSSESSCVTSHTRMYGFRSATELVVVATTAIAADRPTLWPASVARCKGVFPSSSCKFNLLPFNSRNEHAITDPCNK